MTWEYSEYLLSIKLNKYIPVDHPEKICKECHTKFKPKASHQKFCNKKCYKKYGKKHLRHSRGKNKNAYTKFKKPICESCGFVPIHLCQLDVDHIDGDHANHALENLQTLCANCHRLKTAHQLGWVVKV